jgi:hypothetical protein
LANNFQYFFKDRKKDLHFFHFFLAKALNFNLKLCNSSTLQLNKFSSDKLLVDSSPDGSGILLCSVSVARDIADSRTRGLLKSGCVLLKKNVVAIFVDSKSLSGNFNVLMGVCQLQMTTFTKIKLRWQKVKILKKR